MTKRAAPYIRVSTEEQEQKDLSLDFQLETCRALAVKNGWDVVAVYQDVGSAKTDQREQFQKLIADAKEGLFDIVIVYKYSRFARSDIDSALYERELNKKGIELVSATELIDTTTSAGWINKRILQVFAEFDNRQKAEFVKSGMKQKLLKGEWPWEAPVGYINHNDGKEKRSRRTWVEIDPYKAPLVVKLFEGADDGKTLWDLCDLAEAFGLITVRKKKFTPQKMSETLRNPFYKGRVVSPKFEIDIKGKHEPLIDEAMWDRVQIKMAIRSRVPYCNHRPKHILRGLTRCSCGMAMTSEFHDNNTNNYLRCVSNANKRYKPCGQIGPRIDSVIGQIEGEILPMLAITTEQVTTIREELKGLVQHDYHVIEAEAQLLKEQLIKLDARAKGLITMRADNDITKEEYRVRKGEVDIDKAQRTHSLEMKNIVLAKCDEDLNQALSVASEITDLWRNANDEGKHELLEKVIVKIVIHDKKISDVEFRMPYNLIARWKADPIAIKAKI
ncbi:MAG: recombinase family protein [Dehalococcoidia bacterium]|jgi:DNA invertase Pin-like site-specific DNA recombinase